MSKKKTAEQLQMEADKLAEQLKKARAEAKKAKRLEDAERSRIELEKRKQEALELIEISKKCKLQSGCSIYEYLVSQRNAKKRIRFAKIVR